MHADGRLPDVKTGYLKEVPLTFFDKVVGTAKVDADGSVSIEVTDEELIARIWQPELLSLSVGFEEAQPAIHNVFDQDV